MAVGCVSVSVLVGESLTPRASPADAIATAPDGRPTPRSAQAPASGHPETEAATRAAAPLITVGNLPR